MSGSKLKKLKIMELKVELKSRGLNMKGNKAILVEHLEKALKAECAEAVKDAFTL